MIAHSLCTLADVPTWGHTDWRALLADLVATGKPVGAITLGDVAQAIAARREHTKPGDADQYGAIASGEVPVGGAA